MQPVPTALPAGPAGLVDLLDAVDDAIVSGDTHRARRLLAQARSIAQGAEVVKRRAKR